MSDHLNKCPCGTHSKAACDLAGVCGQSDSRTPSTASTAGGERQSIDTPEFRQMLWTLWDEESSVAAFDGPQSHVSRIIAHIDTWAGRSAGDAVPAASTEKDEKERYAAYVAECHKRELKPASIESFKVVMAEVDRDICNMLIRRCRVPDGNTEKPGQS